MLKIYYTEKKINTEWLNLIRFLSVFFVAWTHFEYMVFAEVHPQSINLEELFFMPPAISSWVLYGYTGKYAVAMLCVISGFVTALSMKKSKQSFFTYVIKRYMRIMIPVIGITMLTAFTMMISGEKIGIEQVLMGSLIPGSTLFYGHFWCLSSFLLGNYMIYGIEKLMMNLNTFSKILSMGCTIFLGMWGAYKIGSWMIAWALGVVMGYLLYEIVSNMEMIFSKWLYIPIVLIIWYLPRGYESFKIYILDMAACFLVLFVLFNIKIGTTKINDFCQRKYIAKILKYSYSFYVVHGFSLKYFACDLALWIQGWTNNWWITYVISFVVKTLFDMGLAVLIYYLFENMLYKKLCTVLKI